MVIMNDDLSLLSRSIEIARRTRRVMLQAVFLWPWVGSRGYDCSNVWSNPAVVGAFGQEAIDVVSIVWALNAVREVK